jgi:adenylate cyclase
MAATKVERRLAAILAADVVGYSRLMEADEAGTFGRLKELRRELIEPVLREHGGRFVELKGDGAIVEFASVTDAVEAAVAIQRAMQARDPDLPEGPAHPLPCRHQPGRRHRRRRDHIRRRHQRRCADRGLV